MLVIPAINIKNGVCVSVKSSQIDDAKTYSDDLADTVGRWFDQGVERLHLVDLDGAQTGQTVNAELIKQVAFRFPNLSMQVSGGIRSVSDIEMYLKAGLDYVVLGTKAFQDPEFVSKASLVFPGKLIVSIDSLDEKVLVDARAKETDFDSLEFASQFDLPSLAYLILSDKSESVQGINIDYVAKIAARVTVPVLAAGGLEDMDDVRALFAESHKGIAGVISSSSLQEGSLKLNEAQDYCNEFED